MAIPKQLPDPAYRVLVATRRADGYEVEIEEGQGTIALEFAVNSLANDVTRSDHWDYVDATVTAWSENQGYGARKATELLLVFRRRPTPKAETGG